LFCGAGERHGQAEALNNLGELLTRTSATRQGRDRHTQALAIARELGLLPEEARALEGIANSHLHEGSPGQAAAPLQQALAIYQHLGTPDEKHIQHTLREHGI
jgi:Tfp pilus assembly protein PilF